MADTLQDKLKADIITAMKARGDESAKSRLVVLRLVSAAIKQNQIDNGHVVLDDAGVLTVLNKMVKQRKDSMEQYEKAGREDLYKQEAFELSVISEYMPKQLTSHELSQIIDEALANTNPESIKDMGKVMAYLKPKLQGRADMSVVSREIKEKLN